MKYRMCLPAAGLLLACGVVSAQPPQPDSPIPPRPPMAAPGRPSAMPGQPPTMKSDPNVADDAKIDKMKKDYEWPNEIDDKTLEEWIRDLDPKTNSDATLREVAVKVIPSFGPAAQKAVPALTATIKDPDPGVRIAAMVVLTGMSMEDKKEVRMVAEAMGYVITHTSPGSAMRLHAARSLTALGPDAHYAIGSVVKLIDDPWWETRQAAAAALGRIGAPAFFDKDKDAAADTIIIPKREASKPAMTKLAVTMLQDESATVRMEAAQSLLVLGPPFNPDPLGYKVEVQPYINAIKQRIRQEKDPNIQVWLHLIHMMYDDREFEIGIPALAKYTEDPELSVRVQALTALAVLGPKAKTALEDVIRCLLQEDQNVVFAAVSCLVEMDYEAKGALSQLETLKEETEDKATIELLERAITSIKDAKEPKPAAFGLGLQR